MRRFAIVTSLLTLLAAVSVSVAAAVTPGTYTGTINPANAPASSHLASGTIECTVNADLSINCDNYVLGGVGNTNATVSLSASYSALINCTNKGGNLVEVHSATFSAGSSATVASTRNGQLRVTAQSVSPFSAPQVCPNPNWTPSIAAGTLVLETFTYSLTFAGFSSPAVLITASDP